MSLDYLAHLSADAERFADVLRRTDPGTRVPSCPDWDADDLLWHLGEVFSFWDAIVRDRRSTPDVAEPDRPAGRDALLEFYGRTRDALVADLAGAADGDPVWTWSADRSVGFVRRRMAHEALIHRLDAELTAGELSAVAPELADDGVHEVLQHFLGGAPEWSTWRPDGPIGRLASTDTGGEWLVQLGGFSGQSPNTGKMYDHEPALELVDAGRPDFTLHATARDLDAWLWGRPPLAQPEVTGDEAGFAQLRALVAKGIDRCRNPRGC